MSLKAVKGGKLEEQFLKTIKKFNLINDGDSIVVGVSGGPDSICLLTMLNKFKQKLNIKIYVAHINHMLREEADSETEYVKEYCDKLGIEYFVKKVDITKKSEDDKTGTEEAGRNARYEFFEEVFKKTNSNKIATAHNSNDNAETVLMNIIRGAGTSGLKGIEPIRDNKFIRPIIECERKDIEEYCEVNKLNPKFDKSNKENVYTRNKIRNLLIPYIQKEFNPNIIASVNRLSELAQEENKYLDDQAKKTLNKLTIKQNSAEIVLKLKEFNELSNVIKSRIILKAIEIVVGTTQGIEKIHINDIIKLCGNNIGNKYLKPNKNIKVAVGNGEITLSKI